MAHVYKRGRQYWISYYVNGTLVQKSLRTTNERVARSKKKRLEYELTLGDLHIASRTPLPAILEAFCNELKATRTFKSYKNDFSRLRVFFGPVCDSLLPGIPGARLGTKPTATGYDKYAGRHVKAALLEDITPEVVNRFLAARIQRDGWSAKTVNLMRQTLHKLFSYAIRHHGFRSRDTRYPNPLKAVDKKKEPAPQIRFLRTQEIRRQLDILATLPVIHTAVATYIYAGLRREEALWLAVNTGGVYYFAPTSEDLLKIYQDIAVILKNQYIVTYDTGVCESDNPDGLEHELEILVNVGDAFGQGAKRFTCPTTCSFGIDN